MFYRKKRIKKDTPVLNLSLWNIQNQRDRLQSLAERIFIEDSQLPVYPRVNMTEVYAIQGDLEIAQKTLEKQFNGDKNAFFR